MKKVLLVDDEPDIMLLVHRCLEPLGIAVVHAHCLGEAVEMARSEEIGLVLLDLALGDEDGLEILPALREEPRLADVPVVAFTAHESRRREALACGANSFLARPFAANDLAATVNLMLVR